MNAITKPQSLLSTPQVVRLTDLITQAVAGFKKNFVHKNNFGATDEEIDAFTRKVEPGIIKSILKADESHDASKRDARIKAVKALAVLHGVKFTHRREIEEVIVDSEIHDEDARGFTEVLYTDLVNSTRGGQTIAFKYELDGANDLHIRYVVAFCRADENFDPLIGMEESLKKFLANHTLTTQVTHERFGQVKLTQLSDTYKEAELNAKAFVKAKVTQTA